RYRTSVAHDGQLPGLPEEFMNMGVTIRPSALVTTLAAPCIACFGRRLMAAAGPRILVRQRAMTGSAGPATAAAETSRERRRATSSRRSARDGLRDGLRNHARLP